LQPNTPLELTPLRVSKIVPILEAGLNPSVFPIYQYGAAQRQAVRRLRITTVVTSNLEASHSCPLMFDAGVNEVEHDYSSCRRR
jgi:hypothetical protein